MPSLFPVDGPHDREHAASPLLTTADLRDWVRDRIQLSDNQEAQLFKAIESVVASQRQLVEESKQDAIRAMAEGFAEKMAR
ncbi:MAG: hypothetical protein ABJC51_08765, partial [Acidobacteriota bacterium]